MEVLPDLVSGKVYLLDGFKAHLIWQKLKTVNFYNKKVKVVYGGFNTRAVATTSLLDTSGTIYVVCPSTYTDIVIDTPPHKNNIVIILTNGNNASTRLGKKVGAHVEKINLTAFKTNVDQNLFEKHDDYQIIKQALVGLATEPTKYKWIDQLVSQPKSALIRFFYIPDRPQSLGLCAILTNVTKGVYCPVLLYYWYRYYEAKPHYINNPEIGARLFFNWVYIATNTLATSREPGFTKSNKFYNFVPSLEAKKLFLKLLK